MIAVPLTRALLLLAAVALPSGSTVGGNAIPAANDTHSANDATTRDLERWVGSSGMVFRGRVMRAPPGVHALTSTAILLGALVVEFPPDVTVEFNEKGEAIFALDEGVKPRSWVLTVGKKKLVASANAHAIVPLPGVGEPRIEWSRFAYPVPAPRDFLNRARDLKDPLDASPYR